MIICSSPNTNNSPRFVGMLLSPLLLFHIQRGLNNFISIFCVYHISSLLHDLLLYIVFAFQLIEFFHPIYLFSNSLKTTKIFCFKKDIFRAIIHLESFCLPYNVKLFPLEIFWLKNRMRDGCILYPNITFSFVSQLISVLI